MIHQFIFAAPRPGWTAERFQDYWLREHAVRYASRIRQIRQYLVAPRVRLTGLPPEVPAFEGVAEIWLRNDEEQIESMLSPEFLEGARADEPHWAAFWMTFVHEADAEVISGDDPGAPGLFKIYLFLKRRSGTDLQAFRRELREAVAPRADALPGLTLRVLAPARDGAYGLGEPRFDALVVLGFYSRSDAESALSSEPWLELTLPLLELVELRYFFTYAGEDHWVIRPGERV